jgi:hypothetical protein
MPSCVSGNRKTYGCTFPKNRIAHDVHVRVRTEEIDLPPEARRLADVVGIHARDQRRTALGVGAVQRGDEPDVALVAEHAHARLPGELLQNLPCHVRRTIVDDQELEVSKVLGKHTGDSLAHMARGVVGGHDVADRRCFRRVVHGLHFAPRYAFDRMADQTRLSGRRMKAGTCGYTR